MMVIYKTTNKVNGKCYIGQDSNDNSKYLGSGIALQKAIKKHGRENFTKEIMAWCDTKEKLDFLEKLYIEMFDSRVHHNGYNITLGGEGVLGVPSWKKGLTAKTDERLLYLTLPKTKEHREAIGRANIGKHSTLRGPQSPEHIEKRSRAMKGKGTGKQPNRTKDHHGEKNPMFGRKRPDTSERNRLYGHM